MLLYMATYWSQTNAIKKLDLSLKNKGNKINMAVIISWLKSVLTSTLLGFDYMFIIIIVHSVPIPLCTNIYQLIFILFNCIQINQ